MKHEQDCAFADAACVWPSELPTLNLDSVIGLALFVILELTVFIGVLNNTAMDLLVKPVAGILHVIRTKAGKVMAALDQDDVSGLDTLLGHLRMPHASA